MSFISVAAGQPIRSTHVQQFTNWLTGAKKDTSGTITTTHATEYTLTLTNENTSAGNAFKVVSGASTVALFNGSGVSLSFASGTVSAPGMNFLSATGVGVQLVNATEAALVASSAAALDFRRGPKGSPQVGIGQPAGAGAFDWSSDPNGDSVLRVHHVNTSATSGHLIGITSLVRTEANTTSSVFPDSAGISSYIYQNSTQANGAIRAIEAQAIRLDPSTANQHSNATMYGAEIGVHSAATGNGLWKTGGIHLISSVVGEMTSAGARADVGIWIRGDLGFTWPLRVDDETALGLGTIFLVDSAGRVRAGDSGNAAAPSHSFVTASNAGMFYASTSVAISASGSEVARFNSTGVSIGTVPVSGNKLTVQGNTLFVSGATNTTTLFQIGRTGVDAQMVVAGSPNQYVVGTLTGDWAFRSETGQQIHFGIDSTGIQVINATGVTVTKNLAFSGTAARIQMDTANATQASRTFFQDKTTNTSTLVGALPNGSATTAGYAALNSATATDAGFVQISVTGTAAALESGINGSGSYVPLRVLVGGTVAQAWATNGNVTRAFGEAITGVITPTALSTTTSDWAPTGITTARMIRAEASGASRDLTGIAAQASGTMLTIFNVGSGTNVVLKHATGSSAANQILTPNGADLTISPSGSASLWYDGTSSKWRVMD